MKLVPLLPELPSISHSQWIPSGKTKALGAKRASPFAKDTCLAAPFGDTGVAPGQGCSKAEEQVTLAADLPLSWRAGLMLEHLLPH